MVNYNPNMSGLLAKHDRSTIEYAELGRKGGIASGEARRRKRDLKETMEILLAMPTLPGEVYELSEHDDGVCFADMKYLNLRVADRIACNLINKALDGDIKALKLICDITEEDIGHNNNAYVQESNVKIKFFQQTVDGEIIPMK